MGFKLSKITKTAKKVFNNTNAIGMTAKAIKKVTGLNEEKQLGIGALAATSAAVMGGLGGTSAAAASAKTPGALTATGLANVGGLPLSSMAGGAGGSTLGSMLSGGAGGIAAGLTSGGLNVLGSAIGAAGSYAGSMYAAGKSAQSAQQINERQIQWERERATNAHQWEIEDLKNAGLNPVLSAGGQGAVTGGISAVQPDTSGYQAAGQAMQNFFQMLNNNRLANAQADSINAQTTAQLLQNPYVKPQAKAQLANTIATTKLNNAHSAKALSDINVNAANAVKLISDAEFNKRRASGKGWHAEVGLHGNILGQEVGGNIGGGYNY